MKPIASLLAMSLALVSAASAADIDAQRFTFTHAGEPIVGVLFRPADAPADARLPVVVIEPPWTQVKEQVVTTYGRALAARGYAMVAFDHRHWGESGGTPCQWENPAAKISDLRGVLSYLRTRPDIDPARIYGVGVCFGVGYMAAPAAEDADLRAFATVAAWIHDTPSLKATFGDEGYALRERTGREAGEKFRSAGEVATIPAFANDVPLAAMMGPLDCYANARRGALPAWKNAFALEGARVAFNGRRSELGAKVEAALRARGRGPVYRRRCSRRNARPRLRRRDDPALRPHRHRVQQRRPRGPAPETHRPPPA